MAEFTRDGEGQMIGGVNTATLRLPPRPTGCPEKFDFINPKKFEFMFGVKFVSD